MPIFQTLTNYFTGSVDARAKFLVAETTIGAVSGFKSILTSSDLNLLDDKFNFKVVLKPSHLPKKAFILFNSTDYDEAIESFTLLEKKVVPMLKCSQDLYALANLQKICDAIFLCPSYTSYQLAIVAGLTEVINDKAMTTKAVVNEREALKGKNALMVAIETENIDIVNTVLGVKDLEMGALDNDGNHCFHYAARTAEPSIIKILATKNTSFLNTLNKQGESALHEACKHKRPDNVEMLMRWKSDPFLSKAKNYPLHSALHNNCLECVKVLLSWKPGLLKLKDSDGNSALHLVSDKNLIDYLLEQGCCLEDRNNDGLTPLLLFIRDGNYQACMALLVKEANLMARDHKDNGSLHYAVMSGDENMIKSMVVFGAELDLCNSDSVSPRHVAATGDFANKDRILYYLHEAGARRCSHDKVNCKEGCKSSGTYNGAKPPQKESSQSSLGEVPYVVEEFRIFKSTLDAALLRVKEGYLVDGVNRSRRAGYRVLCLDGGGIRGLVSIQLLQALENISGKHTYELFDWISGTSTGGILAIGILQRKSLNSMMMSYLRLKNQVFRGKRPYDTEVFESMLKDYFGEYTKMTDFLEPKVMLFSAIVDRIPAKLHLFRNYSHPGVPHDYSPSPFKQFPPTCKPEDQYVWQSIRATGAAPTYFRAFGRFMDGGLIANNPTLDCMSEIVKYNEAVRTTNPGINPPPIHVVVSVGTGQSPVRFVEEFDLYRPGALWDFPKLVSGAINLKEQVYHQTTSSDGSPISKASSWCNSILAPYFRFNPPLTASVQLDVMDDLMLVQMMWEMHCFLHTCQDQLVQLVHLLS